MIDADGLTLRFAGRGGSRPTTQRRNSRTIELQVPEESTAQRWHIQIELQSAGACAWSGGAPCSIVFQQPPLAGEGFLRAVADFNAVQAVFERVKD
jgi:hypothetical protein